MNKGRPYLQVWRGVWVSFCKIAIVSFLSVRYRSDGLYCRLAGTRSSPTMLFIRVGIKNRVGDDGGPTILQCRSSDLYLTYRKENMAIYPHCSPHLQIRPSLVHPFLPQDLDVPCNAQASEKGSLRNNMAWWSLPAPSIPMPPPSPTTSHHHTPLLLTSIIFLDISFFR